LVANYDVSAEIALNFYGVSFAKPYDVNSTANSSPPERLLWAALVNRKLGASFRRQVPLAGYICDFVCASRRLVLEVDGAHHARRTAADARRDACLARLGYRVLRLEAQLVLSQVPHHIATFDGSCR
jgi:very-short-patch-repair endonuclease